MRRVRGRYMYGRGKFPLPSDFREKLNAAFKEMRKEGLMARQNYLCCRSCASYALASTFEEKVEKDPKTLQKVKGTVFYHKQSTDDLLNPNMEMFYLQYGQLSTSKGSESGLSSKEVGESVKKILTKHGITVKWDGDPNVSIEVFKNFTAPVQNDEGPMELVGLS